MKQAIKIIIVCSFAVSGISARENLPVKAELIAEETSIQPGRPFLVGIYLSMSDHYHTYWKNPGDSGLPSQIEWTLPAGFKAGPIQWPYPSRFESELEVTFGYNDQVVLLTRLIPPESLPASAVTLQTKVNWLACSDACIPGQAELSLRLPVKSVHPKDHKQHALLIRSALKSLPRPDDKWIVTALAEQNKIVVKLTPPEKLTDIKVFIEQESVVSYTENNRLEKQGDQYSKTFQKSPYLTELPEQLKGVVIYETENTKKKAIKFKTVIN
ncbi:MAG: protein-disulfide reductase DsbD family protein [candidate division KSB1 bacterium]|nr:protein-disulfide reductase DsbD family protein [candidate division KSB1 bacterium]